MIGQAEMKTAIEIAVMGAAELGETIPITPETLGFDAFDSQDRLLLGQLLHEQFETLSIMRLEQGVICIGKVPDAEVYLLAQTNQVGKVVYSISPTQ